jgi:hypothetical protein
VRWVGIWRFIPAPTARLDEQRFSLRQDLTGERHDGSAGWPTTDGGSRCERPAPRQRLGASVLVLGAFAVVAGW